MASDATGIRQKDYNQPNFPAGEPRGSEVLKWGTDIISDPADPAEADLTEGWQRGIGIGSPTG